MESLSRLQLYQNMLQMDWFNENQRSAIEVNIDVLRDIEPLFLSQDENPERKEVKDPVFFYVFRENVESIRVRWQESNINGFSKLYYRLIELGRVYSQRDEGNDANSRNLFNQILRALGEFNHNYFPNGTIPGPIDEVERGDKPQVFLSHAYDDRLFAAVLFKYFYNNGIYLYVDWMHNGPQKDGIKLKSILERELENSVQLLFLRTINSELNIQGKQMLRSWCAWELGNFYRKDKDQKFLLNLYSVERYGNSSNLQLHGLKLFTGINQGVLFGIEITP